MAMKEKRPEDFFEVGICPSPEEFRFFLRVSEGTEVNGVQLPYTFLYRPPNITIGCKTHTYREWLKNGHFYARSYEVHKKAAGVYCWLVHAVGRNEMAFRRSIERSNAECRKAIEGAKEVMTETSRSALLGVTRARQGAKKKAKATAKVAARKRR
jgi:hypothetical protein